MRSISLAVILLSTAPFCATGSAGDPLPERDNREYSGRSLAQWHKLMMDIDPRSSSAVVVVEPLIEIVADESLSAVNRGMFADYLARVGEPAQNVVPILASLIDNRHADSDMNYRWAARALALMGESGEAATPSLIGLLNDDSLPVKDRQSAVEALALIGGAHAEAIPALSKLLQYRESEHVSQRDASTLRQLAADAFFIVGPGGEVAAPLLIRMVRDRSEGEFSRLSAIKALGAMKSRGAIAIAAVSESLTAEQSPVLRDAAADALVQFGSAASRSLLHFLQDPDPEIRWRIAYSLREITGSHATIRTSLSKLLDDNVPIVRISAAESIHELFGSSDRVVDTAISLLKGRDREIRVRAKELTIASKPLKEEHLMRIRELLRHKDRHVARVASSTLDRLSQGVSEANGEPASR